MRNQRVENPQLACWTNELSLWRARAGRAGTMQVVGILLTLLGAGGIIVSVAWAPGLWAAAGAGVGCLVLLVGSLLHRRFSHHLDYYVAEGNRVWALLSQHQREHRRKSMTHHSQEVS